MLSRRIFAACGLCSAIGLAGSAAEAAALKAPPTGATRPCLESPLVMEDERLQVATGVPHSGWNGAQPPRIVATCIAGKDKPLASPA